MVEILNSYEPDEETLDVLLAAADVLGVDICWYYRRGFHFRLSEDWTVSITPETAGRLRVETWRLLRLRDRKWCRSGDCNRLSSLIRDAQATALSLA